MNHQDRNELKEYLSHKIQERINQIRSITKLEVTPDDLLEYAGSLGVLALWEDYNDTLKKYDEAKKDMENARAYLFAAIPVTSRPHYQDGVSSTIIEGAKALVENRYYQTSEGQKIQQLKKEQANLGASLLMISLPDEVRSLIDRIELLVSEGQ